MKKRKELDALVTNGSRTKLSNNKKKTMPSHKEEGHELLLNIESDSGSSLDLDFSPPKRTFVRKPNVCNICLSGCVLVLLVASLIMSIALLWMNFDLKNDVDGLRQRLELVEKESSTSKSQLDSSGALINGLEKNINDSRNKLKENVERLDMKLVEVNNKIVELNTTSLALKNKVQALLTPKQAVAADDPQLQKVVAGLGSEVEELKGTVQVVQSSQKQQHEDIQSLSKNVADLQVNETFLNQSTIASTVASMTQASHEQGTSAPPLVHPSAIPASNASVTKASNNTQQPDAVVADYFEQELRKLSSVIGALNASLFTVEQQQTDFSERLNLISSSIPLGVQTANSTVNLIDILKLQSDVKSLMAHVGNENSSLSTGDSNAHDVMMMHAQIAVLQLTVDTLTDKVKQLNTPSLNNNLLNMNTTLGIQTIMTNSLNHFKEENIQNLNDVKFTLSQVQMKTENHQESIDALQRQLQDMHRLLLDIINNSNTPVSVTNKTIVTSAPPPVNPTNAVTPTMQPPTESLPGATELGDTLYPTTPTQAVNDTFQDLLPPPYGYLELPGVNSIEDVKARFRIWNMERGYVTFEEMENFLGPGFKGTSQLEQFDYDRNSQLNEEEIVEAFGFQDVHNRRRFQEGPPITTPAPGGV
ncbi:uncharacterized protein [Antedon mediterranea]|uniref:uncharacterized protein isoform X2 n=1 Tax=Antedon mediterranea TaxID=105859 RepID=UPI003AF5807F